jgi:tRNA 2-selenouridine synthase
MSDDIISAEQAYQLLIGGEQIIDVRSESEFANSNIPGEINAPILNDAERKEVGTTYKMQGPKAAIELGEKLVSGKVKEERIDSWLRCISQNNGKRIKALTCARGGLRSEYAVRWLTDSAVTLPKVKGGYKSLRKCCLDTLTTKIANVNFIIITGLTGSGKTELLHQLSGKRNYIDLEDLAKHRGSSFGGLGQTQPGNASFENALALNLERNLQSNANQDSTIIMEDESRSIGSCFLPPQLWSKMLSAPRIVLEEDIRSRSLRIYRDYVKDNFDRQDLLLALSRIKKQLGGLVYERIRIKLEQAKVLEEHLDWIEDLLNSYYDQRYQYSFSRLKPKVLLKGNYSEVLARLIGG